MRKVFTIGFLIILTLTTYGQINESDSTAQVIAYWDMHETHTYIITNEKVKIQEGDTIFREFSKYEVDITVQDSTDNEYVVNWFYRDFQLESDDELIIKLSSIFKDMNVQIKTDELGVFKEVVNWEDIMEFIFKGTSMLKSEFKDIPNMNKFISQIENMYSSKQAIEASAINEIQQFLFFHGLKYKLWEDYSYEEKLMNMFGGEPFDANVVFGLDEINVDENNAVFRMHQEVDSLQLTNETFNYLTEMAETMQISPPERDDFPYFKNQTWIASRIHGSGWLIYSIQTKEVTAENAIQIDECIIELK